MKTFLFKVAAFALFVILFCIGFELFLLLLPNSYSVKRDYLEEHKDEVNTLVLGHSHFHNGLDPRVLPGNAYDAAEGGRVAYYDARMAERYIPRMKNLKLVLWPLGYNFQYLSYLYDNNVEGAEAVLGDTHESFRCMYAKYFGWAYGEPMWKTWSELLNSRLDLRGRLNLRNGAALLAKNESLKGWAPMETAAPEVVETKFLPKVVDYDTENARLAFEENLGYVNTISQLCRERGVQFVVVTTPVYKSYQAKLTERGMQELARFVDELQAKNPDLIYLSYLHDTDYEVTDFCNASHLSECGVVKFSRRLAPRAFRAGITPSGQIIHVLLRYRNRRASGRFL